MLFAVQSLYDAKYAERTSEGRLKHDEVRLLLAFWNGGVTYLVAIESP